jgi:type IV pilus assembly protein PilO
MALNTEISLQDLTAQFRGLNLNEPETWPTAPRVAFSALAAAIVLALGWQFYWSDKSDDLDRKRAEQETLKQQFQTKVAQVANLDALVAQKAEVEKRVALAEHQLPNSTEMDALLADVNHAGVARGLQFELFKPQPATIKAYYAEIPVNLKVTGRYHDVALFNADVAALADCFDGEPEHVGEQGRHAINGSRRHGLPCIGSRRAGRAAQGSRGRREEGQGRCQVSRLTRRPPMALRAVAVAALAVVALAGCGAGEDEHLQQWMAQTRAAKVPPPEPLPEVKPYEPRQYAGTKSRALRADEDRRVEQGDVGVAGGRTAARAP